MKQQNEEDFDEELDEEEPRLKYNRLKIPDSINADNTISSISVSDKLIALGSHQGKVFILDITGTTLISEFSTHSATVNELSIDSHGEFVASASDDGKVAINSLYNPSDSVIYNYKRAVKAIALEPDYSKKNTKQFASGGMAEILNISGKGWFASTNVVIHSGEGPVYTIRWRNNFIAWANEIGVKIYDTIAQQKFAVIDRPVNSPRSDLFKCSLCWKNDDTLLIGWADSVKLGVIKERSKMDIASGLPKFCFEIFVQFKTDFIVVGIAPLDNNLVVLLSFIADVNEEVAKIDVIPDSPRKKQLSKAPEVNILDFEGTEIANDVLSVKGFENFKANDYRLEYLAATSENTFFIVTPRDIIVARPTDIDDHIQWLVDRKKYEEALIIAEGDTNSSQKIKNIVAVGQKWMHDLIKQQRFTEAAANCPKILRNDIELWESWFFIFAEAKQIPVLLEYIPTHPKLSLLVYEMVLAFYLYHDPKVLLSLIVLWNPELYTSDNVIDAIFDAFKHDDKNIVLMEYEHQKNFKQILYFGLRLYRRDIINLVKDHNLYSYITGNDAYSTSISMLFQYDEWMTELDWKELMESEDTRNSLPPSIWKIRRASQQPAVKMLIDGVDRIAMHTVVNELVNRYPKFLFIYLDCLWKSDCDSSEYHQMQIELFAEYDYGRMIEFLRSSVHYSIPRVYAICEIKDLVPEMVYLLGKMGDNRKALMLIINRLGDVSRALAFCQDQKDEDLWEDLLKYAMDKPSFIVGMLENLGSFINPLRLVQRIPKDLEIPGLKNAIIKIMSDFSIQVSLRQGCEKILLSDTTDLLEQLHKAQIAALQIDSNDTCSICKNLLINRDGNQSEDNVVVLFCRHAFHSHCLNISERQVLDSEVILLKKMAKADGIVYRGKAEDDMMMNSTKSIDFDKPFVCTICGS